MNDGQDKLTGLRDVRKPCHFWVDNEVADCYQAIVGADAIWVYCRIARNAHGAWIVSPKRRDGDTRVSLREMAEWCGKSVDTVWRCLQVLEHVGLLQAVHGAKSGGRYALVDVKDLVTREGAEYDRTIGSFQLPAARVDELKQQVKELRAKLARKNGYQSASVSGLKSVAQSDRSEGLIFSVSDEKCDSFVAQSDTSVAPDVHTSITTRKQESKTNTPPTPIATEEKSEERKTEDVETPEFTEEQKAELAKMRPEDREMWERYFREENLKGAEDRKAEAALREEEKALQAEYSDLETALEQVRKHCGFVWARNREEPLAKILRQVLQDRVDAGDPVWRIGPRMVKAWLARRAQWRYGPAAFFSNGEWVKGS